MDEEIDTDIEEPAEPALIRDPPPQPLFSARRGVIALLLLVAVGFLVVAVKSGESTDGGDNPSGIASFLPEPGGRVLRQSELGVILEPGYDGRISVNGVAIPEEQMAGALDPDSEAWKQLTEEERSRGPRPNTKERVLFAPGEGKVIDEFDTGAVQIEVTFWKISEGPSTARTFPYTVNVA